MTMPHSQTITSAVPGLERLTGAERMVFGRVLSKEYQRQAPRYLRDVRQLGEVGAAFMGVARFAMSPVPLLAILMIVGAALSDTLLAGLAFGVAAGLCGVAMARSTSATRLAVVPAASSSRRSGRRFGGR